MNVGVFSLMQQPAGLRADEVYANEIAQAVEAERLGFDRAWFAEHHFSPYGIAPSIHLLLAHVAAKTTRIRLGTAVTVLPFFHPLRVAEELAMVDILSGGRIDWGVGRGYQRHEFDAFGVPITESRERFCETLEIVFRAWQDGPFDWRGGFWDFDAVDVLPKPLQSMSTVGDERIARIPTFIAAISPESVTWAGARGLPILTDQFAPSSRLAEVAKELRAARVAAGLPAVGGETPALRQVFVAESTAAARRIAAPALLWYYRMLAKIGSPARHGADMPSGYEAYGLFSKLSGVVLDGDGEGFLDYLFDQVAICGTAAEVTDRLTGLHEAGFTSTICWMNFGGVAHEATLSSMRRFMDDVAPNLPR